MGRTCQRALGCKKGKSGIYLNVNIKEPVTLNYFWLTEKQDTSFPGCPGVE
jgi:hypothetical protein